MTKNLMTKATKFLLAFVLVIGGFNATATSAFAQEIDSNDVVVELTSDSAEELVTDLMAELELATSQDAGTLLSTFTSDIAAPSKEDAPTAFTAFALDQAVIDAQTAAIETLTDSMASMDAAIDASVNMSDEQKATEKSSVQLIGSLYTTLINEAVTVEEIDALVLEITALTDVVVDALVALDVAKTDAITQLDTKLAETLAAINALTSLTLEEQQSYLDEAQANYDLALDYIMTSTTPEMVQSVLDVATEIFDVIIWAANFDDRINAINARLKQAHEIITNNPNLTGEQANALIDSMNAIVEQANTDMEAATTIEELDAILDAAILELNVILDNIIYASVEITKSVDKTTAFVGDILTYTLTVKNTGDVVLGNLRVRESWDSNLVHMVSGSLTVDNFLVGVGDLDGFGGTLRPIDVNETITITFQVVVLEAALNQAITNTFSVYGTQLSPETVVSNTVVTNVIDGSVTLTPGEDATLPNTGLDNSSLFLSVTALMVGALTLVLALRRNRNV